MILYTLNQDTVVLGVSSCLLTRRSWVRTQRDPTSFAEKCRHRVSHESVARVSQSRASCEETIDEANSNERTPAAVNQWMMREEEDVRARVLWIRLGT